MDRRELPQCRLACIGVGKKTLKRCWGVCLCTTRPSFTIYWIMLYVCLVGTRWIFKELSSWCLTCSDSYTVCGSLAKVCCKLSFFVPISYLEFKINMSRSGVSAWHLLGGGGGRGFFGVTGWASSEIKKIINVLKPDIYLDKNNLFFLTVHTPRLHFIVETVGIYSLSSEADTKILCGVIS